MLEKGLEKRIVQMLCCVPNQPVLRKIVEEQHGVDFQYIANEFPIMTTEGYGFLDIIGKIPDENFILLLECKPHRRLLSKAKNQAQYYTESIESYGFVQKKNLLGLYHRDIMSEFWNLKSSFDSRPLVVDRATILRNSKLSIEDLLTRYRNYMLEWIESAYRIARRRIEEAVPSDHVPVYVIDLLKRGKRRSFICHYGLTHPLQLSVLKGPIVGAPLKLPPDKSNYETLRRMSKVKASNRFSIQVHRYGHSRPMLFFEVDEKFSACFIHTGRHQIELNGYYESAKVLSKPERIHGIIRAEDGRYVVSEAKSNRLTLELNGRRCQGCLKLNFLDEIYLDDDIALTNTLQTTLENH